MIPVKPQESSSRRSSILKPPKSRHPLHFVDFNSSPENSPTTKQTRRVSFAEKKHVKEFVDSVERGTLWDNTYEENESGGGKFACASHCEDNGNVENRNPMDGTHLSQLETAKTFMRELTAGSYSNLYNNKDEIGSFQNECDMSQEECDLDLTDAVGGIETTKVTDQMNNLDNYTMHRQPRVHNNQENEIKTTNMDKTVCHDMSMELTAAIPSYTSSCPDTSNAICTTLTEEEQYFNPSSQSYMEGINVRSNTVGSDLENSIDLENKTMEFTRAVTRQNAFTKFILNKENINNLPYIDGNTEDSFKECTASVQRTKKFENQSMILTECIPSKYIVTSNTESVEKTYKSRDDMDEWHQDKFSLTVDFNKQNRAETEKTKIFCDTSIEMTNAIRSVIETRDLDRSNKRNETLGNMSMEMTNVISRAKSLIKADETIDEMKNRSARHDYFNGVKNILTNKVNIDRTISEGTEQTRCFQNMSMELTTLVPTRVANNNLTDSIKLPHKKRDYSEYMEYYQETNNKGTEEHMEARKIVEEDKTKLFKDMSMEITTAIPLAVSVPQDIVTDGKEVRHNVSRTTGKNDKEMDTESNMTKLFKNVPMEMTTVIDQAVPNVQQGVSSSFKCYNEHEKPVEPNDKVDVIEHQEIRNTVTKNIYDKIMVEPRKSILMENTSTEQKTGISESTINMHANRTYNMKKPWNCYNSSIVKIAPVVTEESKKKDTAHKSISQEAINENMLFENESMEITNRISIAAQPSVTNISVGTNVCADTNRTGQLYINTSPTKRTYVIRKGCCTQVNESMVSDTDITLGCEEACINKNVSDHRNISTYNNEPIHADNSILSELINTAEHINKDVSNISIIGDEMYMIDIENRPTCLISNDSYEEKNGDDSYELSSSEKKELTYSEETYKRISPVSRKDNQITEASANISTLNDVPEDPFVTWMNSINIYSERDDCVWNVRCLNEKIFALDFISGSLVVVMHFEKDENKAINNFQRINIISRLTDDADPILLLVHRIIMDKINPESLIKTYCMPDDFFPLTEHISKVVIFAMDFMFEYKQLYNTAVVDIIEKRIQFTLWTKTMNTILDISIDINTLDSINLNDVEVECILGSVRVDDIKKLIVNAKKDHRYLSRCINDVKEYLTWMEETG